MKSKFYIGQKVICTGTFEVCEGEIDPQKGSIYTVREIYISCKNNPCVLLEEIRNKYQWCNTLKGDQFTERGFLESKFAPVANIKIEFSELANKELILN